MDIPKETVQRVLSLLERLEWFEADDTSAESRPICPECRSQKTRYLGPPGIHDSACEMEAIIAELKVALETITPESASCPDGRGFL